MVEVEFPDEIKKYVLKLKAYLLNEDINANHIVAFDYRRLLDAQSTSYPFSTKIEDIYKMEKEKGFTVQQIKERVHHNFCVATALRQHLNRKLIRFADCDIYLTSFCTLALGE